MNFDGEMTMIRGITRENIPLKAAGGYTLLEVVFVVSIATALLMWGMPSVVQSIRNNQVASQTVSLLAMLNFTKSESVRRNTGVDIVFTMYNGGWDAVVEDPNHEVEVAGCVLGQLRCTSNTGAALSIPADDEEPAAESLSSGTEAVEPGEEEAVGVTFEMTFNNRGYIRDRDDVWTPQTIFLQHDQCSGQNQRTRIDITPTGQISSCSLACNSTAACQ